MHVWNVWYDFTFISHVFLYNFTYLSWSWSFMINLDNYMVSVHVIKMLWWLFNIDRIIQMPPSCLQLFYNWSCMTMIWHIFLSFHIHFTCTKIFSHLFHIILISIPAIYIFEHKHIYNKFNLIYHLSNYMLISCLWNFTPISWWHVLSLLDLKKFHINFTCFDHVKRRTTFHMVISHGNDVK